MMDINPDNDLFDDARYYAIPYSSTRQGARSATMLAHKGDPGSSLACFSDWDC